jgi:hypothetical protein
MSAEVEWHRQLESSIKRSPPEVEQWVPSLEEFNQSLDRIHDVPIKEKKNGLRSPIQVGDPEEEEEAEVCWREAGNTITVVRKDIGSLVEENDRLRQSMARLEGSTQLMQQEAEGQRALIGTLIKAVRRKLSRGCEPERSTP